MSAQDPIFNDVLGFIEREKANATFRPRIPGEGLYPGAPSTGDIAMGNQTQGGQPVGGMALPQTGTASPAMTGNIRPAPYVGPDPGQRMDTWRNLLTDFVWSLGQGLAARRPGNQAAGIGEAIQGPWTLQAMKLQQQQIAQQNYLRQAQEERNLAAAQQAMATVEKYRTELPARVQEIVARTGKDVAQTGVAQSEIPLNVARTGEAQATTLKTLQDAAKASFIPLGSSLYRLSDLMAPDASNVKPVAMDGVAITITPDIAKQLGNPQLAGQTVSAKVGQQLTSMVSEANKQAVTAGGVLRTNLATGQTTNLGAPAVEARPVEVINPNTNLPQYQTAATAIASGATPGTLSDVQKLTGQAASFANFHSNANRLKATLPAIDQPGAPERITAALAQPASTLGQYIQGKLATGQLTNAEYDMINALSTFREDIFNLRQFFGNSPIRSDKQVGLMLAQLPDIRDLATGNSAQVERKIDNFERAISVIEGQYGPLMSLIKKYGANPQPSTPVQPANPNADFIMQGGRLVPNPNKR